MTVKELVNKKPRTIKLFRARVIQSLNYSDSLSGVIRLEPGEHLFCLDSFVAPGLPLIASGILELEVVDGSETLG